LRIFDTNYLFENFGGSISASSNVNAAPFAFRELKFLNWTSNGENNDLNEAYLERILDDSLSTNRIVLLGCNLTTPVIQVDTGSGYADLSNFTKITSNDGLNHLFVLDSVISISKIKVKGSTTIVANQEKYVQQMMAFKEIANLPNFADIQPSKDRIQAINKLANGKVDIINKGYTWSFKIKFKAHYSAADNIYISEILNRDSEMWIWINDDLEDVIFMKQEPYRFQDFYKVAFQKKHSPQFNKNAFYSGLDVDFDLIEVA
jgi:hypothetical protein